MRYPTVSDYGVIGNHFCSALVSKMGSIDWCCFPYLDSPCHFSAIIDTNHGGRFQIAPQGEYRSEQRYVPKTQILETIFETPLGRGVLTDWIPVDNKATPEAVLCRKVEVTEGQIPWTLICTPRFRYGLDQAQAEKHPRGILFRGSFAEDLSVLHSDIHLGISSNNTSGSAQFTLNSGESAQFVWSWGRRGTLSEIVSKKKQIEIQTESTAQYWQKIAHQCPASGCPFGGPWHDLITRSGLLLRLLIAPYSGSVAEAVAVSLKGPLPTSHTWGHRYASVRDGALIIQAFANLGYIEEAHAYFAWLKEIIERDGAEALQPFYTLDGGRVIPEREPPYVSGHTAPRQFQLDIYGHVMLAVSEYYKLFGILPDDLWPKLAEIADYVCQAWKRPDYGPWGLTHKPEHFVVSKLFCWTALDQVCWLAKKTNRNPSPRWIGEKNILHRTICEQGFDTERNSFIRSFGGREIDSSVLWIPFLNFLNIDDPRVHGTLDAVQSQLSDGVLIKRYRNLYEIQNEEPLDLWSSFFFISCLALSGRTQEASDRLAELCTYASPLGLFGDQVNPIHDEMPKNFPSAAVHLSLINSALYVGAARGRRRPVTLLIGSQATLTPPHSLTG